MRNIGLLILAMGFLLYILYSFIISDYSFLEIIYTFLYFFIIYFAVTYWDDILNVIKGNNPYKIC